MSDGAEMSCDPFDDEDWADLEKPSHGGARKPDVTVTLSIWRGRNTRANSEPPRVRARIVLRREAAEWISAHEPRFRVQIAGAGCNLLRIVADAARGSYEAAEIKGVRVITLGVVNVWPNETRREVEARFRVTEGGLVLTLPEDFAKPGAGEAVAMAAPAVVAAPVARAVGAAPAPAPLVRRRALVMPGEPPPGRSALDQRRGDR
ncbi:hypothetical protein EDE12_106160 [Methylosinus sp. sav-2]|uniref:hypothetical protein n=1 Tax=Methylosinus sp. sav-2 TaxID=2485168 RepID=UPI0004788C27|nr:hypothetical protein [Methylosinus sp. sav-2]TDX64015.1 hypothetical protein EDE12_106160 [Methylosinus sp. sav-2]